MCRLLFSFLIIISCRTWAAEGSGEQLAQPFTVILSEVWHYNQPTPVYQVRVEHADHVTDLQAAAAAVASVRPEFQQFTPALAANISNYVVGKTQQGNQTVIYIHRSIIADWLIMS